MPATFTSIMCSVATGRSSSPSQSTPSSSSSPPLSPEDEDSPHHHHHSNGFSSTVHHNQHHLKGAGTTGRRKYHNSISTSCSSTTTSLERNSASCSTSSGSEACLSRAEKDVQTGEHTSEEEEPGEAGESEEEEEDVVVKPRRKPVQEEESFIDQPFATCWGFANGTQRTMISSVVGDKAPISNVVPMDEHDLDVVERAHRESRLAELYADLSWRFYTHPPTAFILARVHMTHGLTGEEGMNEWKLPRKSVRRDSDCSTLSSSTSSSPALDESTLIKILPTDEFHAGRGVASPSPPAALIQEPLSRMDVLSEKIWDYHNKVAQTDEMLQRKLHLRDMLYMAISPVFPMSGLYVVGSSLNGFGNNSSDMDLCLMITNKDLDQKNDAVVVLNLILSTLQYEKFVASQKLILAKVPILRIKFAAPFDDITVDLNANNSVAIRNTHLLCYYSSYDWRVRPLVSVVKEWAKRKGINDANKSSFTSYSLVLMVIHYLQCGTASKVLPNLQQAYSSRFSNKVDVRTLNVTMPLEPVADSLEDLSSSEKTTLGELLIGFLDYYANKFDYDRDAISIRQGQRVERATLAARPKLHSTSDKETPPPSSSASTTSLHNGVGMLPMHHSMMANPHFWRSQWRCVCIEEPFTNSNTAHSIYDEMVFGAIKEAFREAHAELEHNHDLDRLMDCEPIKVSTTNAGAAVFAATYEGERPMAQQPTTIATASLRAMSVLPTSAPFHFQNQPVAQSSSSQHVLKQQQRPGSNQGYQQMNNNRNGNGSNPRRSYNNGQQSNGAPRSSKSSENTYKDGQRRQSAKENNTPTTSPTSEKKYGQQQQQARKDDGTKPKHQRSLQSPEPYKQKPSSPSPSSTSTAV